jgi:hypothetical protein
MNISYVVCKKWGGVMKELFKERTSKFQSLVSLIVICAMLTLFVFALPEFFCQLLVEYLLRPGLRWR